MQAYAGEVLLKCRSQVLKTLWNEIKIVWLTWEKIPHLYLMVGDFSLSYFSKPSYTPICNRCKSNLVISIYLVQLMFPCFCFWVPSAYGTFCCPLCTTWDRQISHRLRDYSLSKPLNFCDFASFLKSYHDSVRS